MMSNSSNNQVLCVGQSKNRPLIHKALMVLDACMKTDFVYFFMHMVAKTHFLVTNTCMFSVSTSYIKSSKTGAALTVLASVLNLFHLIDAQVAK